MSGLSVNAFQPQSVTVLENGAAPPAEKSAAKTSGFGFGDLIDTLNPLHHIPVVGQIYRAVTGDKISDTARMAGGGLYAGPLGVGIAAATMSMRDDDRADGDLVQQQESPAPTQETAQTPQVQAMGEYDRISQGYWTQSNLQALAHSFGLKAPETADKSDAPSMGAYKVPDVSDPETLAPAGEVALGNSAIYAQMLANLEKLDASGAAPR